MFTMLDILGMFAHIRVYFGRFRQIQNPSTGRHIYIKAYSELRAYSGVFRTVDRFSQFHTRDSGVTQE